MGIQKNVLSTKLIGAESGVTTRVLTQREWPNNKPPWQKLAIDQFHERRYMICKGTIAIVKYVGLRDDTDWLCNIFVAEEVDMLEVVPNLTPHSILLLPGSIAVESVVEVADIERGTSGVLVSNLSVNALLARRCSISPKIQRSYREFCRSASQFFTSNGELAV